MCSDFKTTTVQTNPSQRVHNSWGETVSPHGSGTGADTWAVLAKWWRRIVWTSCGERLWCLTSTEVSRPIRDWDEWERGTEVWNLETRANLEDQGCRGPPPEQQNVRAVSVQHWAATTAPRNCCPNCYSEQSHKDNVRSSAVGETTEAKSPTLQLSSTSLLLISSGLTSSWESSSPPSSCSRLDSVPHVDGPFHLKYPGCHTIQPKLAG